ncbi:pentapeptide repeat-containing protein [Anaerocolumna sp. MB42-C2]|uniref:pentapeptide repeat-containing protein n=1 Tax=Anaerocolumna sp. MB42-C2 TaxID=3070997 RepID=UPI0027DFBAA2|nr:pentapeptide repeat-containing protein [Anaerocolumna sp. MB42-C2]WMJ90287.1 pentapeptide repeat-containing protein [Anaerocolumna sp. MB42-C2]
MQQYFEGRTSEKYTEIKSNTKIENKIIANERPDKNWKSEHYIVNNTTFAKMGFREAKFSSDDFKFNVFIDCYFKKAYFDNVNFSGSIFINCNFDEVTIVNCVFDYCKFDNCIIAYKYLKESISERPNIRWELCKNLSLECLKIGDESNYRKYFFEEKKASEKYYWKKFWHKGNEPYYKKYNWVDQFSGLFNFLLSKLNKTLWGYGEKLSRLFLNVVIVQVFFVVSYMCSIKSLQGEVKMSFPTAIYISLCNFFTVTCDYNSTKLSYKILSVTEGGLGIILTGFFVAALFRYINRRG